MPFHRGLLLKVSEVVVTHMTDQLALELMSYPDQRDVMIESARQGVRDGVVAILADRGITDQPTIDDFTTASIAAFNTRVAQFVVPNTGGHA